jgi:hypothetical protein
MVHLLQINGCHWFFPQAYMSNINALLDFSSGIKVLNHLIPYFATKCKPKMHSIACKNKLCEILRWD